MAGKDQIILVANPGSASRKYALYQGTKLLANLHFEYVNQHIVAHFRTQAHSHDVKVQLNKLSEAISLVGDIFAHFRLLPKDATYDFVVIRLVAPGDFFAADHLVDDDFLTKLKAIQPEAPLHAGLILQELATLKKILPKTPIVAMSDSAFHVNRARITNYYAIDPVVADKYGIKRYGFHGLSVASIADYLQRHKLPGKKVIVAHLGSGSSVTALINGTSLDNSMGFSPLEGLVMATRSGDIDVSAALSLKHHLNMTEDQIVNYLNTSSGLLGVSGESGDLRDLIALRNDGDDRASLAISLYVHHLQGMIGRMAAELNGVDALVFTGTVGQRSEEIRRLVLKKLEFLGFTLDSKKNMVEIEKGHRIISTESSKPIYVIRTDETAEMVMAAQRILTTAATPAACPKHAGLV
ncbi:hypothetical protein FWF48_02310 [Candidatus Saccharibacteria bacterium]|nr:hypothetical protein [Candidatus Saccharibacteria bacterium]